MLAILRFFAHILASVLFGPFIAAIGWLTVNLPHKEQQVSKAVGELAFLATAGIILSWWILIPASLISYAVFVISLKRVTNRRMVIGILTLGYYVALGIAHGLLLQSASIIIIALLIGIFMYPIYGFIWKIYPHSALINNDERT